MSDQFDGFTINVSQDDDGDWLAYFLELPNVSAFSDTADNALHELSEAWKAMKGSYKKHGDPVPVAPTRKKYSGQFNVRIDKRVHRELAIEAVHAGISLNALVAQKLAQAADKHAN